MLPFKGAEAVCSACGEPLAIMALVVLKLFYHYMAASEPCRVDGFNFRSLIYIEYLAVSRPHSKLLYGLFLRLNFTF